MSSKTKPGPPEPIQLIAEGGCLYTPLDAIVDDLTRRFVADPEGHNPILLYEYPSGDHDTIKWPGYKAEHLRGALYDCRETGLIPDHRTVLLPDGTTFTIDA